MKGCGDYGANIELLLDKELSGRELEEFRAHLEECEVSRAELREEESAAQITHCLRYLTHGSSLLDENSRKQLRNAPSLSKHGKLPSAWVRQFSTASLAIPESPKIRPAKK